LIVKAYLQGYYIGGGFMRSTLYDLGISMDETATDSVTIDLWNTSSLSHLQPTHSFRGLLHNDGKITIGLPESINGALFYIAIRHRNSIETWSANTIQIGDSTIYDYTDMLNRAYSDGFANPMAEVENGVYALYGGDVNQDGTVDIFDIMVAENDAIDISYGYNSSDSNGDGGTDLFDMQLIENNSGLFLFTSRPY
jgi:hypothetical protein